MTDMPASHRRERGVSIVMLTFLVAFVLIPMIGLAIDGAVLFWMKAKLSAAVDAAALGAARSLDVGANFIQQKANAEALGGQYFDANFPVGILRTTLVSSSVTVTKDDTKHTLTATATASVSVPTYFMRILHFDSSTVAATGQASRRNAIVVLVLDRSGSMTNKGSCDALISNAQDFVNRFVDDFDTVGLVTFQTSANIDFTPVKKFKSSTPSLKSTLDKLVCGGNTNAAAGLKKAYTWFQDNVTKNSGYLNAILFFTDGQPNVVQGTFKMKKKLDTRYDSTPLGILLLPVPKSNCDSSPLNGLIADDSDENGASDIWTLNHFGQTSGLFQTGSISIDKKGSLKKISGADNCAFDSDTDRMREDVRAIPDTDDFGGSTHGNPYLPTLDVLSAPYAGEIRPDTPRNIHWAAFNSAESIAKQIRDDKDYGIIIYTIGLQGNESMEMDQGFMERVANDPRAANYDSDPAKGQGKFALASDKSELAAAFSAIASQLLHLSQ